MGLARDWLTKWVGQSKCHRKIGNKSLKYAFLPYISSINGGFLCVKIEINVLNTSYPVHEGI